VGVEFRRQLRALRVVFSNPALRTTQIALAVARAVDLAQLVALSGYLYGTGGVGAVAAYGIVRAVLPVPVLDTMVSRLATVGSGPERRSWLKVAR
jgi:hypothetical protein